MIKMILQLFVILTISIGLSGCKISPCPTFKAWYYTGHSIDDLIKNTQPPTKIIKNANGSVTYFFEYMKTEKQPVETPDYPPVNTSKDVLWRRPMTKPLSEVTIVMHYVLKVNTNIHRKIEDYACEQL